MKRATAVFGSAFGDEGKGLLTDFFCRQAQEKPIVIRFNGGAQAGHTVVTPEGKRHVFHHYGAGTLAGADTYLSKYFLVNPDAWVEEHAELHQLLGKLPNLYIDPSAPVTTIYDMYVNQKLEESRGKERHGSCGMGINETMVRHQEVKLTYADLENSGCDDRIERVRQFAIARLVQFGLYNEETHNWMEDRDILSLFMQHCSLLLKHSTPVPSECFQDDKREIIFEGAQGLLLDSENRRFFPHVTHSRTGLTNVIALAPQLGIDNLDVCYVARSYLTRHGAGELPGEDPNLKYFDNTNNLNDWQGSLRFAKQDDKLLNEAICGDIKNNCISPIKYDFKLALTHCDQNDEYSPDVSIEIGYCSYGPTANDISERRRSKSNSMRRKGLQKPSTSLQGT